MSLSRSTYHSKIFREFKGIPSESHREIIRFYDENESAILQLDFEEYFELLVAYVDALFVIGKYRQHLLLVDVVIENVIQRNIFSFQERDLYYEMLIFKGLSCLHTYEFTRAEHIFKQLIKIDPSRQEVVSYLEKSIRSIGAPIQYRARAISIGLLFLAAFVIGVEILLIRPFYEMYAAGFEWTRIVFFIIACLITVLGETIHWRRSKKKAAHFQQLVYEEKWRKEHPE